MVLAYILMVRLFDRVLDMQNLQELSGPPSQLLRGWPGYVHSLTV